MDSLSIIKKLNHEAQSLQEFIAPVVNTIETIRVIINNHPYRFRVTVPTPGWYVFKPTSSTTAVLVREAFPFERALCLHASASLCTIAMRRVDSSRWLAFPFNQSEAAQKGAQMQPFVTLLVSENIEPFTIVMTREWAGQYLFDSIMAPPLKEFTEQLEKGLENPPSGKGVGPELKTVYSLLTDEITEARKKTVEGRIKSSVEFLGAELVGYKEFGDGYDVQYRDHGQVYRARISGSLRLQSAGICLSGLENQQSLTSCVAVMRRKGGYTRQYFNDDEDEVSDYDD